MGLIRISLIDLIKGKEQIINRKNKPSIRIYINPNSQLGNKEIKDKEGNIYKFQLELKEINYKVLNNNHLDMISYLCKNNII